MAEILGIQENYNNPFLLYTTGKENNVRISKDPVESIDILQSTITEEKKSTKIQSTINIFKYIFEKIYENIFTLPCIILFLVSGYKLILFKNLEKEGDIEHIKQLQEKGEKVKEIKEKTELLISLKNSDKEDDIRQRSTLESEIPVLISNIEKNYVDSENKLKDSYKWSTIVIIMGLNSLAIFYFLYKIRKIYKEYRKTHKKGLKDVSTEISKEPSANTEETTEKPRFDWSSAISGDRGESKRKSNRLKDAGKAAAGGLKSGAEAVAGGLKSGAEAAAGGLKSGAEAAAGGLKAAGAAAAAAAGRLKTGSDKIKKNEDNKPQNKKVMNPMNEQEGGKEDEKDKKDDKKDDKDNETESGFSWFRLFYIVFYIIMIGIHIYFIYSFISSLILIEETIDMVCGEESVIPADGTTKAFCDSIGS